MMIMEKMGHMIEKDMSDTKKYQRRKKEIKKKELLEVLGR